MEVLLEVIVELILDWTMYDTDDKIEMPRGVRIGLLILAILIYIGFIVALVFGLVSEESTFVKAIIAGVVLFLGGMIVFLWRRVLKVRK